MGRAGRSPGSASTACARGSRIGSGYIPVRRGDHHLDLFLLFPQNEHDSRSPEPGTRPLYPGSSTGPLSLIVSLDDPDRSSRRPKRPAYVGLMEHLSLRAAPCRDESRDRASANRSPESFVNGLVFTLKGLTLGW